MKISQLVLIVGAVGAFVSIAWSAEPLVPTVATQVFLTDHPGTRMMVQRERLVALQGVPFATDADPATDTDAFVDSFLQQNGDALGVDMPDVCPDRPSQGNHTKRREHEPPDSATGR